MNISVKTGDFSAFWLNMYYQLTFSFAKGLTFFIAFWKKGGSFSGGLAKAAADSGGEQLLLAVAHRELGLHLLYPGDCQQQLFFFGVKIVIEVCLP